jgi:catechol 2,3-dioxygenase-like lactoylglutathione lyase family enzyme
MLDHVSITVSDIAAAERFYDAIMKTLDVVKVGRRDDWLGYGERARPAYPDRGRVPSRGVTLSRRTLRGASLIVKTACSQTSNPSAHIATADRPPW